MKRKIILLIIITIGVVLIAFANIPVLKTLAINPPTFTSIVNIDSTSIKLNFKSTNNCETCGIEILNVTTGVYYRVSNKATSYNITGLTEGKKYEFRISAYYIENGIYYNSAWTSSKYIIITKPNENKITLTAPRFISITKEEYNALKLNYSTSSNITGIEIYNNTTGKSITTTNQTTYVYRNLTYNKTYSFKIRTYYKDSTGKYYYSPWSASKSNTVKIPTPTFNTISLSGYNDITFKYKIYGTKVTGIEIYNLTTKKTTKTTNKTNLKISGYPFGQKYNFKIRTYYKSSTGKYYYSYYTAAKPINTKPVLKGNYRKEYTGIKTLSTFSASNCKKIASIYKTGNSTTVQGLAYTGKYYVVTMTSGSGGSARLSVHDKSGKRVKTYSASSLGHGNGLTYGKAGKIYAIHNYHDNNIYCFSASSIASTTSIKKNCKTIKNSVSGISYDSYSNKYYFGGGDKLYIYNSSWKYEETITKKRKGTTQDIGSYGGRILNIVYNGKNSNYIDMYSYKSKAYLGTFSIKLGEELESVVADSEGYLIFLINKPGTPDELWKTKKPVF